MANMNYESWAATVNTPGKMHIGKNLIPLGLAMLMTGCTPNRAPADQAPANTLVRNHQAVAAIVIDKNAGPQIRRAAQTLQTYIAKSTGATLPIRDAAGNDNALHVGRTSFVASRSSLPSSIPPCCITSGWRIRWCIASPSGSTIRRCRAI